MKKILLLGLAFTTLTFTACKKKKSEKSDFDLGYTNLSVEEEKKQIEAAGIDFIKKIGSLPDEKSVIALKNLNNLGFRDQISSVSSLTEISSTQNDKSISKVLELVSETTPGNKKKLSDQYGIYNWDAKKNDWVKVSSSSRLEFKYPASSDSKTNNATLTTTYTASNVTIASGDEDVELPATINTTLKVDGKEELKLTSAYDYKTDGTPTRIENTLIIGSFNFKYKLVNTPSKFSKSFSCAKSEETLLAYDLGMEGNWDYSAISNAESAEDVLKTANTSLQIMTFKVAGQANLKAISEAESSLGDAEGFEFDNKRAEIWNKNSNLVAINTKENKIIAKAEFVADPELETRLVFNDGSKQSVETYFENSFDNLISEFDDFKN